MPDRANYQHEGAAGALLIADEGEGRGLAIEALAAAGISLVRAAAWNEVSEALGSQARIEMIAVETEGADEAALAAALPQVDALRRATDARVVVAFGQDQIDLVADALLGSSADLLCAPTLTERVAAYALAGLGSGTRLHDANGAEAERLRKLKEEVARFTETLAQLIGREDRSMPKPEPALADRRTPYRPGGEGGEERETTPGEVRKLIRMRRLRDQYFDGQMFEDPAWDMLLDLFASELEHRRVSVSSLCIAAAVAPTTALRWIGKMADAGLFERNPDPLDRRRAFMALSPRAHDAMAGYFAAARRQGLGLA